MYDEFVALLALLDVRDTDRLVMLGDLIDKGPDSVGVVSLLRSMRERGHDIVLLMGNHEEKLLRFYKRRLDPASASLMPSHERHRDRVAGLGEPNMAFLQTAVLWHRLPDSGALAVHAGVPPAIKVLPLPEEISALSYKQRIHLQQLLRVRHVNSSGNMIALAKSTPADPFWAGLYDGRFGHAFFGHFSFKDDAAPRRFAHATGLDLGAVYGNRLAAAVIEPGCEPSFVSVPATRAFA